MPEISRFYGIIISMFYEDHNPPHFHARYTNEKATIRIEDLSLLSASLPPRALDLVIEWASLHKNELPANWDLASEHQVLKKIDPLS